MHECPFIYAGKTHTHTVRIDKYAQRNKEITFEEAKEGPLNRELLMGNILREILAQTHHEKIISKHNSRSVGRKLIFVSFLKIDARKQRNRR